MSDRAFVSYVTRAGQSKPWRDRWGCLATIWPHHMCKIRSVASLRSRRIGAAEWSNDLDPLQGRHSASQSDAYTSGREPLSALGLDLRQLLAKPIEVPADAPRHEGVVSVERQLAALQHCISELSVFDARVAAA